MENSKNIMNAADLQRIFSIVKKNWWIVVLLGGLGFAGGSFYAYKQVKIYECSLQLLLKSNDEYNQGSLISDNPTSVVAKAYLDNSNEKRVIQSYDIISQTLDRLDFDVSYFIIGRIKTEEVFEGVPFHVRVITLNEELYEQQIPIQVISPEVYELTYMKGGVSKKVKGNFDQPLINQDMDILVQKAAKFNLVYGKNNVKVSYLFLFHRKNYLINKYRGGLSVENPDYTNVLQLYIKDEIPQRGKMFLDTLAQIYIENSVRSRLDVNQNTLFFIDRQMGEVVDILNNIEDTLQRFREKNAIIDLNKEGIQYFDQYIRFDEQKRQLQLQQGALNDLEDYIIKDKDPKFLPPSAYLMNDMFLQKNVEELYNRQIELNSLQTTVTPSHRIVQQIRSSLDSLKGDMLVYIGNSKIALQNRINNVNSQIDSSYLDLQRIPLKDRGLTNISRKLKVNEDMYVFLLQKRASTVIARGSILPLTKVIEKARPTGKVYPNTQTAVYVATGIGLVIALLIIFVRVVFFERIESVNELKSVTSLPIIGELVRTPLAQELKAVVEHDPKSPVAESFRTIRTNMQYMIGDKSKATVVITSNNPGEGKTFCSINLSTILAKGDRRVLLMELDLHKPRVQKGLGIESSIGISTYAIGKSSIDEIILPSQIPNLDVVLSGPIPPNPSEIIVSQKMEKLIEEVKRRYDYVIIDTPPIGLISDAMVLMKSADLNLFVMNTRMAYRSTVEKAEEIVQFNKLTHFGIILNGVTPRKAKYSYNRYGYGYKYGGYYGSYGSYGSYGYSDPRSGKSSKQK